MNWRRHGMILVVWVGMLEIACAGDGNRLAYLEGPCDPYYVGRSFPRLTTPQWVGEEGVGAVVVLAIDDMRGHEKWEAFVRPALTRLQQIDGRAPVSIMTNTIDPRQPHLQTWLREGLSLEVHTIDHPCPILRDGDFAKAKSTYDRCVDQMAAIPGNRPVAFRTPCCDSLNTSSPRLFTEILHQTTPAGRFLQLDSSVFHLFTPNDPELPRELVLEEGRERFRKYVPFKSFVNTIEDYPYPYVIDRLSWQMPCMVPSDWEAQNILKPNNPRMVADMQRALDATVVKQGNFNLVFHPHGWIRPDQIVALIDHAVKQHGRRVKFLNFRECADRLAQHLLAGQPLRAANGQDNGVRLVDLDGDGYLDVVIGNPQRQMTRVWSPQAKKYVDGPFPTQLVAVDAQGDRTPTGVVFGVLGNTAPVVMLELTAQRQRGWRFDGGAWQEDARLVAGLSLDGTPVVAARDGRDQGVRLRDLDGDGTCELVVANPTRRSVFTWDAAAHAWRRASYALPAGMTLVDAAGRDAGLRFIDLDEDGALDIVFANEERFGVYRFASMTAGWQAISAGKRGDRGALPPIVRGGTNNGMWVHSRSLWWQNEDTARLPDLVDRRSFNDLLGNSPPTAKSPQAALRTMRVRPGFTIELVAAEPLTADPIAFDWGLDGRLYVVEMGDYPTGASAQGKPGGRVRRLEDVDGDGKYDRATTFLAGLGHPTGIMAWRKGMLVCAAPDLLYAEDTNGDGQADVREVLFTGFQPGNPQHRFNGPQWGLDNWVYLANGDSGGEITSRLAGEKVQIRGRDVRLDPDSGRIDAESGQTQFGRSRDDWGNWFGCSNPYPMWHYVLADRYLRRNPHVPPPDPRWFVPKTPMYSPVFPLSRTLARFNDLFTADRITSACSVIVYRDDLFGPEFVGSFFVSEPVHNLVHRQVMRPQGATFTSDRPDDERDREFLASSDNWFRPTSIRVGPDGALWIADMYRAVIEHPEWIPPHMQRDLDLRAGSDRGRIYRVAPIGAPRRTMPRMGELDTEGLLTALGSSNGWQRDVAHRRLLGNQRPDLQTRLETRVRDGNVFARLHALCVLDGLNLLKPELVRAALQDAHVGVRVQAIRLAERFANNAPDVGQALLELVDDPRPPATDLALRLQLACSLGEWRDPRAGQALGKLLLRHHGDEFIRAAAFSSIHEGNVEHVLAAVFAGAAQAGPTGDLIPSLLKLSAALGDDDGIVKVLKVVTQTPGGKREPWQTAALAGVLDELDRRKTTLEQLRAKTGQPDAATHTALGDMFRAARTTLDAATSTDEQRLNAVRLLGREPAHRTADMERLASLLAPQTTATLQSAAIARLGRIDDSQVPRVLLARWAGYSPALRRSVLDVLLTRDAWVTTLLDQLAQGVVSPSDLDATRRQPLLAHSQAAVRERAAKLLAGQVAADRAAVLAEYRKVLSMTGDVARGKTVFEKRCANCHRLRDLGHVVGPDLATLTNRSPEALLIALLDPNRAVEDKFVSYQAILKDGRQVSGILTAETGSSLTLRSQDGKQEVVLRSDLDVLKSTGKSLMPEGLEKDVSATDLADVIAYVAGQGPPPRSFPGNRPETIRPGADGSLALLATNCTIYGSSLMFETQYKNLGHWSQQDDHAAWTIDLPRGGTYDVTLDYACPDITAGETFVFDAGEGRLTGKVRGTGSWDHYAQMPLGRLTLTAGRHTLVFRSEGKPRDHLLDLRGLKLTPSKP